jgi:hypothetical protein
MQKYKQIQGQERVKDSRTTINENFETVLSNSAGDAFPTSGLVLGMKCYRTDLKATYTLKNLNPPQWEKDASGELKKAVNLRINGKVTSDAISFDGSQDVTFNVQSVTADECTGNSATASVANAVKGVNATQDTARAVWFSGVRDEAQRERASNFTFNPARGILAVPRVEGTASRADNAGRADTAGRADSAGSATTAERAVRDSAGNEIASVYARRDGGGAGGTWPINITGTAARASYADVAEVAKRVEGAGNANEAQHAKNADYATNAGHATSADTATRATTADRASTADRAVTVEHRTETLQTVVNIPTSDVGGNIWIAV